MAVELIEQLEPARYQAFLADRSEANFLQSPLWAELHRRLGQTVVCFGVADQTDLQAAGIGIIKNAKRGRYLEVPGGPLGDYDNPAVLAAIMRLLRRLARQHRCVFVRFRPQLLDSPQHRRLLTGDRASTKAPMHLHAEHTTVVDIDPPADQVLAAMRRQTRYEVRRVVKRGLDISWQPATPSVIDQFYDLQIETAKRHHFVQSSRRLLRTLGEVFGDHARMYRAEKDGQLLNLALVLYWGEEAVYFEAASTLAARREPGAYGIVWQAMQDMQQLGCRRFNLWGIAYTANPQHRYAGVTTFKRGFGGQDTAYVPAHDIVVQPLKYPLNWTIETIRRKKRGL